MKFIREYFAKRKLQGKKDSVQNLFFQRAEKFNEKTAEILARIPQALEAFADIIEEQETFKTGGVLRWNEISLVAAGSDDPLMIIVGIVTFPVGAEVLLATGEKVKVTQDTVQYFPPRLIRIGLPVKMAESSKEEIKAYIRQADEEQKKEMEEVKEAVKEALGIEEDAGTSVPVKVVKKKDSVTTTDDFDLTQLTEEQRQNIVLPHKPGRG